jgi:hypothetical protein
MSFEDSDSEVSDNEEMEVNEPDEAIGPKLEDFYVVGKEIGKYVTHFP